MNTTNTEDVLPPESFAIDLLERLVAQPSVAGEDDAIAACLDLIHDALAPFATEIERPVH